HFALRCRTGCLAGEKLLWQHFRNEQPRPWTGLRIAFGDQALVCIYDRSSRDGELFSQFARRGQPSTATEASGDDGLAEQGEYLDLQGSVGVAWHRQPAAQGTARPHVAGRRRGGAARCARLVRRSGLLGHRIMQIDLSLAPSAEK